MPTSSDPESLADLGRVLAEPARAAILLALIDAHARPAGELAAIAGVGAATASEHLRRLRAAGLLRVESQGRHRYYRLAGDEVAHLLESVVGIDRATRLRVPPSRHAADFLRARTCYRHLAGRLGVAVHDRLVDLGTLVLRRDAVRLSASGARLLRDAGWIGDDAGALEAAAGCRCLDWTERRLHLGGALGSALARSAVDAGWLRPRDDSRALRITPRGRAGLRALGVAGID